jgi:hypothetical protein
MESQLPNGKDRCQGLTAQQDQCQRPATKHYPQTTPEGPYKLCTQHFKKYEDKYQPAQFRNAPKHDKHEYIGVDMKIGSTSPVDDDEGENEAATPTQNRG